VEHIASATPWLAAEQQKFRATGSITFPPPEGWFMSYKFSNAARFAAIITCATLLQACTTTAQLKAAAPGASMAIKGVDRKELPRSEDLGSKATGQYEFMAIPAKGEPLYGILPLKVNGGKIVASIMFFAPALFIGGFRDPYTFYEVDADAKALRFRNKEEEDWYTYIPTKGESERAKNYFDALAAGCVKQTPSGPVADCPPQAAAK
jgi:hypothetical protein